jgi:hypothetical protein
VEALLKLKLWGEEPPQKVEQKTEADAMRGKYRLEDLDWRKKQHLANPLPGLSKIDKDGKESEDEEQNVDTMERELSVTTNGLGAIGAIYPPTAKNQKARERLIGITRLCSTNLPVDNKLRQFMERHQRNSHHTFFNRSVKFSEPEIVLTYKPMLMGPGIEAQQSPEQDNKKKQP